MSKRRLTSRCVLCGAETPQDMRYCTRCAGKLLSSRDPASTPTDLPYLISEARAIDARYHDTYPTTTIRYPPISAKQKSGPKHRRLD